MPLYPNNFSVQENGWSITDYNAASAGVKAWTGNPGYAAPSVAAITTGQIRWNKLWLRVPGTVTNIVTFVTTAGGTLTSGQNFVALYDAAGTQVGISADQTTAWGSTGVKTAALTTPYVAAAAGYYVAILSNGTTGPVFSCHGATGSSAINSGLAADSARSAQTSTTNNTAMPASFTVASQNLSSFNVMAWLT